MAESDALRVAFEIALSRRARLVSKRVFDSWWPWRFGKVIAKTKTTVKVRWDDGATWTYDKAHQRFLRQA